VAKNTTARSKYAEVELSSSHDNAKSHTAIRQTSTGTEFLILYRKFVTIQSRKYTCPSHQNEEGSREERPQKIRYHYIAPTTPTLMRADSGTRLVPAWSPSFPTFTKKLIPQLQLIKSNNCVNLLAFARDRLQESGIKYLCLIHVASTITYES